MRTSTHPFTCIHTYIINTYLSTCRLVDLSTGGPVDLELLSITKIRVGLGLGLGLGWCEDCVRVRVNC